jgi:tellurite resistance protein TehA-like permease
MEKQQKLKAFIFPLLALLLAIANYSRLTGTENIKAIHIVTLIAIGMAIGILIKNIIDYLREKN